MYEKLRHKQHFPWWKCWMRKFFFFFLDMKYSASKKMTLVATLVVWSSFCWTRDKVSCGKFLPLKYLVNVSWNSFFKKWIKKLPWQPVNKNNQSSILRFYHKSLWTAKFQDEYRFLQPSSVSTFSLLKDKETFKRDVLSSTHLGDCWGGKKSVSPYIWFL